MQSKWLMTIVTGAAILALFVVMLGAYTRLTNAGLGCPDWPGCYGQLVLPAQADDLQALQHHYPATSIETGKAWTEMAHRYAAGTLAGLILLINILVFSLRLTGRRISVLLPLALLLLVIFQAALGMWTVTLKLLPVVVMSHLLGGMLIFASLCRLTVQLRCIKSFYLPKWHVFIGLGAAIVLTQIALGGWVSANYAGIACIGFPQCNGQWIPALHFYEGFNLFSPIGANYQGGLLDNNVRASIAFIHRLGAIITAFYVIGLSVALLLTTLSKALRITATIAFVLVLVQFTLGILNVIYLLPLQVAVAHNGVAALLLATMFIMLYLSQRGCYEH